MDEKGGIGSVLVDESFNVRELKPGPPDQALEREISSEFVVGLIAPVVRAGDYSLFVSLGLRDGTPKLALPLNNGDGQRRYKLGQIRVRE